jgi:hypothetical protein
MFIREYTAIENIPPLLVIDLPDRSFPVPDQHITQIINSVSSEATTAIRNYGSVSLFIISGINIIDIVMDEKDLRRVISILRRSSHPAFRLHHAYRWKNRAVMRGFVKKSRSNILKENQDPSGRFFAKIAQVYQKSLASPDMPLFSIQVRRLFESLPTEDIVIYSLFEGDLSHIRELAFQATMQRIRLKLRTVAGQDAAKIVTVKKALGIDSLEVIS